MLACLRRRRGVEALIELVVALACAAHARCTRGHNAIAHRPAGTRAGAGRRQQRQGGSGAAGGTVAVAVGGHSEALRASGSTASRASARGVPRPPPYPLRARDRAAHRRCLGAVGQTRRLSGEAYYGTVQPLFKAFPLFFHRAASCRRFQHSEHSENLNTPNNARRATCPPYARNPSTLLNSAPTLAHSPAHQTPAPRVPTPPAACLRLQLQFIQAFPGGRWAQVAHSERPSETRCPVVRHDGSLGQLGAQSGRLIIACVTRALPQRKRKSGV